MEDLVLTCNMKIKTIEIEEKQKKKRKNIQRMKDNIKNVSIPKGIDVESISLEKAKFLCSLPINFRE